MSDFDAVPRFVRDELQAADALFDQGPAERKRAVEMYADLAEWIDPTTPEGAGRVSRLLQIPDVPPAATHALIGRAAVIARDEELRIRARFAAVRFALAREEYGRAEAAALRGLTELRSRGLPESGGAHGVLCGIYAPAGREMELAAALRCATDSPPGGDEEGAAAPVAHAMSRLALDALLAEGGTVRHDLGTFRAGCEGLPAAVAMAFVAPAVLNGLRALVEDGQILRARRILRAAESLVVRSDGSAEGGARLSLIWGEILVAEQRYDAALDICRSTLADAGATRWIAARALLLEARALRATGRAADAVRVAEDLTARLREAGGHIGAGFVLRACARLHHACHGAPGSEAALAGVYALAVDAAAARVAEILVFAQRGRGFGVLSPADRVELRRFRLRWIEAAPAWWDAEAIAEPSAVAAWSIAECLGVPEALFRCPVCVTLHVLGGRDVPAGHLLPPSISARIPVRPCDFCAEPPTV